MNDDETTTPAEPLEASVEDRAAEEAAKLGLGGLANGIARMDQQLADLARVVDGIKKQRAVYEAALIQEFENTGIANVRLDDIGRTVYLHNTVYAGIIGETYSEFVEVLDEHGMGDLAPRTVNPSTLRSMVKEWIETEGEVPKFAEPYISHGFQTRVRTRK